MIGRYKAKVSEYESINNVAKCLIDGTVLGTDRIDMLTTLFILYFSGDAHKIPISQLMAKYKRHIAIIE
jgi:hypothetical protein